MNQRSTIVPRLLQAFTLLLAVVLTVQSALAQTRRQQKKAQRQQSRQQTQQQKKGTTPPARPAPKPKQVGPAVGENTATPIDRITVAKGFEAELLYSVPGVEQGSWVNLCADGKARLIVSDQFGGL